MDKLSIGLISGTSADSISAVAASFHGNQFKVIGSVHDPLPVDIRNQILQGPGLSVREVSELNFVLGRLFAKTAKHLMQKNKISSKKVDVIGSHGQTVYHGPEDATPNTLQIGEPSVIAEETGLPVVSHFRNRDMAAGGQGAPLVPIFENFFYHGGPVRAFLNLGGMANVTIVGKGIKKTLAFDTGPGNSLMDRAIRKITKGKDDYDAGGRLAKKGKIDMAMISQMVQHPFFEKKPPKSTGPEIFGEDFLLHQTFGLKVKPEDLLATLNYFSCITIQEAFRKFIFPHYPVSEILISGGGAFNRTLVKKLECLFAPVPVLLTDKIGIPVQSKEALSFAFFAHRFMQNKSNHLPQTTGAKAERPLGMLTRP